MQITHNNAIHHELIGLDLRVVESTNQCNIGLQGRVVDESRNTFMIDNNGRELVLEKKHEIFTFTLPDGIHVTLDGKLLVARPEDRIAKNITQSHKR